MSNGNRAERIDSGSGQVLRRVRGEQSLRAFAEQLGNCTHAAIANWESNGNVPADVLAEWWHDEREWVRNMARDILVVKFAGIRERFIQDTA